MKIRKIHSFSALGVFWIKNCIPALGVLTVKLMQSTCSWGFYHKSTEKYLLLGFLRKTPRAENYGFFEFSKFRFFEKNPLFFQNFAMGSGVPIFTMYTEPGKKSNLKSELSSSLGSSPNRVTFRRLVRYLIFYGTNDDVYQAS